MGSGAPESPAQGSLDEGHRDAWARLAEVHVSSGRRPAAGGAVTAFTVPRDRCRTRHDRLWAPPRLRRGTRAVTANYCAFAERIAQNPTLGDASCLVMALAIRRHRFLTASDLLHVAFVIDSFLASAREGGQLSAEEQAAAVAPPRSVAPRWTRGDVASTAPLVRNRAARRRAATPTGKGHQHLPKFQVRAARALNIKRYGSRENRRVINTIGAVVFQLRMGLARPS